MKKRIKKNISYFIVIFGIFSFLISSLYIPSFNYYFFSQSYEIEDAKGIRIIRDPLDGSISIIWYTDFLIENFKLKFSNNPIFLNSQFIRPTVEIIGSTNIYTAKISNFNEGDIIYYIIDSDFPSKKEVKSFIVPSTNKDFSFLVWGDTQAYNGNLNERLIRNHLANLAIKFQVDFLLHVGDMTQDGSRQLLWNLMFVDTEVLNSRMPSYYVEGNHDENSRKIKKNINLPIYYSFNYKNSLFIALSSERLIEKQAKWLKTKLDDNKDVRYKFVFFHRPLYDYYETLNQWEDIIKDYDITFIFNGHRHYYKRMTVNGTVHIITGGAGGRLRGTNKSNDNHKYDDYCESIYNFVIVKVKSDSVKLDAFGIKDFQSGLYKINSIKKT